MALFDWILILAGGLFAYYVGWKNRSWLAGLAGVIVVAYGIYSAGLIA